MNRQCRTHSREFKREAVALVTEHGYSYAAAGHSLDQYLTQGLQALNMGCLCRNRIATQNLIPRLVGSK